MKLKNHLQNYLADALIENNSIIELYKEEIDYIKKHQLVQDEGMLVEDNGYSRFEAAYIERSNKETEELIAVEDGRFFKEKINYLRKHIDEFLYIESTWFEFLGVDSVCVEVDDVFGTYEVMLGLKLQKKQEEKIKAELNGLLKKDRKYSLLFNQSDGLWDLNFALNGIEEFHEEMEFGYVCKIIYRFLFKLVEAVEERV